MHVSDPGIPGEAREHVHAQPSAPYRALICVPECGCRLCPGQHGFQSWSALVMHEHVLCEHQVRELEELRARSRARPVHPVRHVPLAQERIPDWLVRHPPE